MVGKRVLAERMRQNLSQEQLFLAARVDRRTLQALEAGRGNPTLATLHRIAYVLDVSVSEFVR